MLSKLHHWLFEKPLVTASPHHVPEHGTVTERKRCVLEVLMIVHCAFCDEPTIVAQEDSAAFRRRLRARTFLCPDHKGFVMVER